MHTIPRQSLHVGDQFTHGLTTATVTGLFHVGTRTTVHFRSHRGSGSFNLYGGQHVIAARLPQPAC